MKRVQRLLPLAAGLAVITFTALSAPEAVGQQANKPAFIDGQIVLYCQPGTPQATVNTLAASVSAVSVTPLLLKDCYELTLPQAQATDAGTIAGAAALNGNPAVRWVGPNRLSYTLVGPPSVTPNDPHFTNGDQWPMTLINMPGAWALQKGTANVADIDTGFDNTHPDLNGQYLLPGFNGNDNSSNIAPDGTDPEYQHGVSTSSIMVANTNNGIGMASIDGWGQTKCLGCKAQFPGVPGALSVTAIINSLQYILKNAVQDNIVAVNESYGGQGDPSNTSDPEYQGNLQLTQAGIIVCAAAGNSGIDNHNDVPAGFTFPGLLTVSATDRSGKLTGYSSFGKVDISAPGGDTFDTGILGNGYLVAVAGSYNFEDGTSFACPTVCGVVTLMRSFGVSAPKVIAALEASANHTITGQTAVPDSNYGFGLVDAYAAVSRIAGSAIITAPDGVNPTDGQSSLPNGQLPPPVETLKPAFQFQLSNVNLNTVNITITDSTGAVTSLVSNGTPASQVTGFTVNGDSTGATGTYTVGFRVPINTQLNTDQITLNITGTPNNPAIPLAADTRTFTIQPHAFPAGLSFVSFPYYESPADSPTGASRDFRAALGASDPTLYRWYNAPMLNSAGQPVVLGQYAQNNPSPAPSVQPGLASLVPTDISTILQNAPSGSPADVAPLGIAYFLKAAEGTVYRTYGTSFPNQIIDIPLHEGWNMIGDPYPFTIAFSALQILTQSGNLYTAQQAADQNIILPYIYRYDGTEYSIETLPQGSLHPWEGHWIYVVPGNVSNLNPNTVYTLEVPPTGSTTNPFGRASSGSSSVTLGGWRLQLTASTVSSVDGNNFIGVTSIPAPAAYTRAPKPPLPVPGVSLGIVPSNGAAGLYQQDLHSPSANQSWKILVSSPTPGSPVTISWPNMAKVPRNLQLTFSDPVTGQQVNMRSRSAYTFTLGAAETTRSFTVSTSQSAGGGRAVLTGLIVDPIATGRNTAAAGYSISYDLSTSAQVDIEVLASNGRMVSIVAPNRAVSAGSNQVVWTGRDVTGKPLPSGVYILQVRAVTPTGDVTRQISPITLTGR